MCISLKAFRAYFRMTDDSLNQRWPNPSRARFKPGFVSYQAENGFTKGSGSPGESTVYL